MSELPSSLISFGSQLEDAIRTYSDIEASGGDARVRRVSRVGRPEARVDRRRHHRRRRRSAIRLAALTTAAAIAIAVVMVGGPFGHEPSASAIERANAALTGTDGQILHVVQRMTLTGPGGASSTTRSETWQQNAAPYDQREVIFDQSDNRRRELAVTGGRFESYDRDTNTIHTMAPDATDPSASSRRFDPSGQRLVESMRDLLQSGRAHEDGRATVDGRQVVRIVSDDEDQTTLLVDAATYEPIEWRSSVTGTGGQFDTETTRIENYEWLPASEHHLAQLSLRMQHPSATILADLTIEGADGPR